jgi:mono/diheme cytochrome c family protein
MLHLSELHGAATHLAVVAIPLYAVVLIVRRTGAGHPALLHGEPWALGAAAAGMVASGITGLLVRGQAQTMLRGSSGGLGTWHLLLGIALALLLAGLVAWRLRTVRVRRPTHGTVFLAGGAVGVLLVVAQGYIGGRMTYDQGVGIQAGGQLAQTAMGTARLERALATRQDRVQAGRAAFSESGLGCASCHGDQAQGDRGPRLAGGAELPDFRRVHATGLFPPQVVSDADFEAIDAYLRTLGPARRRR